jgi:hypothetical protein
MQGWWSALFVGNREDPRRRLAAIFGGEVPSSGQPPAPALAWAAELLDTPRGRVVKSELEAVRLFRSEQPRLLLGPALFLAKHALRERREPPEMVG